MPMAYVSMRRYALSGAHSVANKHDELKVAERAGLQARPLCAPA